MCKALDLRQNNLSPAQNETKLARMLVGAKTVRGNFADDHAE